MPFGTFQHHHHHHHHGGDGQGIDNSSALYWEEPIYCQHLSPVAQVLDVLSMLFLVLAVAWGMGMIGCTRTWGFAIGLLLLAAGIVFAGVREMCVAESPPWRLPWFGWAFVVLVGFVVVRDLFAPAYVAARWDALKWASLLGMGVVWIQLARHPQRWKIILCVLLILGTLEAFVGIYQHVTGSRMVLWMVRPEQYEMRVSGTFLCPNHFASALAVLIPVALAVLFAPGAGIALKMMAVYYLAAAFPSLLWSVSRSGIVGALLGMGATVVLVLWRYSRKWFWISLVATPVLLAGILAATIVASPDLQSRFDNSFGSDNSSWMARSNMWHDSPGMVHDSPVVGHGGGQWVWAYPRYQRLAKLNLLYDYPHNDYVQVLVEYGFVGAGLLLVAMLSAAIAWMRALRRVRDPVAAWFLAGAGGSVVAASAHAVFDFNFHIFPIPVLLVTVAASAWGAVLGLDAERAFVHGDDGEEDRPVSAQPRWGRIALGASVALIALWGGLVTFRAGMSYWRTLEGEMLRSQNRGDDALPKYLAAIAWDSRNDMPHTGLGSLYISQASWLQDTDPDARAAARAARAAEAEAEYRRAAKLNPLDPLPIYGIGRARKLQADPEGALEAFRVASALQPMNRYYSRQVAMQLRSMGRRDEAIALLGSRLDQGIASSRENLLHRSLLQDHR